ncbi:MAG: hypothetical protein RSE44_27235, partial [Pseudomonas sp.]
MPTENRSSNTEQMVSVPRDEVERLVKLLQYQAHPCPSPHAEFWQGLLDAAAQHQGEPVAWLIRRWVPGENPSPWSSAITKPEHPSLEAKPLYLHPPTPDGA